MSSAPHTEITTNPSSNSILEMRQSTSSPEKNVNHAKESADEETQSGQGNGENSRVRDEKQRHQRDQEDLRDEEMMQGDALDPEMMELFEKLKEEAHGLKVGVAPCQVCSMSGIEGESASDATTPASSPKTSQYRCPGCQLLYCSLQCSKKHKELFKCSGERDPTQFASLSEYNHSTLSSDFRFLEDQKNKQIKLQTFRSRKRMREPDDFRIAKKELFLISRARDKECFLKILAQGMKRRTENRTHFINGKEVFIWNTRFFFDHDLRRFGEADDAADQPLILRSNVSEDVTVREAFATVMRNLSASQRQELENYTRRLSGSKSETSATEIAATSTESTTTSAAPECFSDDIIFLLRLETAQREGHWFVKMNPQNTIVRNLRKRVIVEQPDIHVVLQQSLGKYQVMSAEEAAEMYNDEVNNFHERRSKRIKHRERVERYDRKTGDGSNIVNWEQVFDDDAPGDDKESAQAENVAQPKDTPETNSAPQTENAAETHCAPRAENQ